MPPRAALPHDGPGRGGDRQRQRGGDPAQGGGPARGAVRERIGASVKRGKLDCTLRFDTAIPLRALGKKFSKDLDKVREYVTNFDKDTERNKFDQLKRATQLITDDVKKLEKDLGQDAEIKQPHDGRNNPFPR